MKITPYLFLILFCLIFLNSSHLIYFNIFTHSLPFGIYMKTTGTPQKGDYAASCLTPRIAQYGISRRYLAQGNCDTGTVLVLKMIKGLPGERFVMKNKFLEINGYSYRIMDHDSSGRALGFFINRRKAF